MTIVVNYGLQRKLEGELERLKRILELGYELRVRWIPNNNSKISEEVKGQTIFVYDEEEELAVETLKHEFIDYATSKVIEPYKEATNKLITLINEEAYRRKERLVGIISKLIDDNWVNSKLHLIFCIPTSLVLPLHL